MKARSRKLFVEVVMLTVLVMLAGCSGAGHRGSEPNSWQDYVATIIAIVVPLIVLTIFIKSWLFTTRQETAKIVERFGKFHKVSHAGLCGKAPFGVDKVAKTLSLKTMEIAVSIGLKSNDNAFLEVPVKIQLKIVKGRERQAYYELDDPFKQMLSYVTNIIRSAANDMSMDQIFQSKDAFEKAAVDGLKEQFEKYGYEIVNVLVDDPQPSAKLREAFDEVLASKRRMEAAKNDAEATRTKMVGEASAEGESLEIKAKAYVKQRDIVADGIVAAAKKLEGIPELSSERIFDFLEGIDWRDAIRDASKGPGSTIVVPANFTGHTETIAMTKALTSKVREGSEAAAA